MSCPKARAGGLWTLCETVAHMGPNGRAVAFGGQSRIPAQPARQGLACARGAGAVLRAGSNQGAAMGIDKQSEIAANLQIGPTTLGMVRIYVEADGVDLPLDFDPDDADEIAEELRAAAQAARAMGDKPKKR